ncbi:MAG TPA: type VI secretion system tube protein Hcp [Polyangiaceae bacterium]|jgi:type VI secretion system secreted protein Hcp|nr:type VI secretion system tube protein Hcp [Polyangiaceae bacterium]
MDLILLQPGDPELIKEDNSWLTGGTLINTTISKDATWSSSNAGFVANFKPERCIELVSIHQGMKQQMTTDVSNSSRTSGRPIITEFTCVKYVDATSVKFYERCMRALPLGIGKDAPTSIYVCRNSGEVMANIMTFQLRDAMISEIQYQTHPNDMPTEQFKLSFTEVIWTATVQRADTKGVKGQLTSGWSLARNSPIGAFTD